MGTDVVSNVILSWLGVQASLLSEVAHALRLLPTFPLTRLWSAIKMGDTMDHAKAAFGKVGIATATLPWLAQEAA